METLAQYGLFYSLGIFLIGALGSAVLGGKDDRTSSAFAHVAAVLGSLTALAAGLAVFFSGSTVSTQAWSFGAGITATLRIDPLAALFIAIISTVAVAASLYGLGYQKHYFGAYRLRHFGFFYNLFLASMLLVIAANSAVLFLFAWELMAVVSYFLVIFERREPGNIKAGTLYILISQLGALFLFGAFLLIYRYTGSWDFDTLRASSGAIPFIAQNVILAFALIGFAAKAGVIPLHIWLPEAHPAAPSHVSALMSGVMLKTAIFMIVRFFIEFFPNAHSSWGLIILLLGAVSSLLGVLYALSEHDIKRLLAFHSVENIGIILLGVGASIFFFSYGAPALGAAALIAALYHTLNHALFKGLLFLSAGSVASGTGTRNMEEHGGLLRLMPWTGFFFLVGAAAISGLPPLNGFVSEWLTFQSLFAGIAALPFLPKVIFLAGAASLALTGGLAAACFVKAFGSVFLAKPRSQHAEHAHENGFPMQAGMALLAVLTVVFGVCASTVTPLLAYAAAHLRGDIAAPELVSPLSVIAFGSFSSLSMTGVAAILAGAVLITYLVSLALRRRVVVSRTWDCGAPLTPRMEITATGFSRSLITIFGGLLRPSIQTHTEFHDADIRYFRKSKTVHLSLPDLYRRHLYLPAVSLIEQSAGHARRIQTGNLNTYVLYMFIALIILLVWALK